MAVIRLGRSTTRLTGQLNRTALYAAEVPPPLRGRWCRLACDLPAQRSTTIARIRIINQQGHSALGDIHLEPPRMRLFMRRRVTVLFVPLASSRFELELVGADTPPEHLMLHVHSIFRSVAAGYIALCHPLRVWRALRGARTGRTGRLRAALAIPAAGSAPGSYLRWIELFDSWSTAELASLCQSPRRSEWPEISAVVLTVAAASPDRPDSLRETIASLDRQIVPPVSVVLSRAGAKPTGSGTRSDYVAILQAGEVLAPHALALLADAAVNLDRPDVLLADEDSLTPNGVRTAPIFKPQPNHALMLSGTLTRGVWLVRRDVLPDPPTDQQEWAEALRLSIWLRLYERNGAIATHRVPYVLTHRRADAEEAPPEVLAGIVRAHLARMRLVASVSAGVPLRVIFAPPPNAAEKVSIIVPSTCRSAHVLRCLRAVLDKTAYPDFELLLVISQGAPIDQQQQALVDALTTDARVRCVLHHTAAFNYAAANNHAAGIAEGALLCLLNDDVEPTEPAWLARMVGHLADRRVGIVGARLCYPNGLVQHGGIIMGLGGLSDHANRFRQRDDPGYASRNLLDQEMSAVTGACLLTRRSLYRSLGGLDEAYAASHNDVDFCLRTREAGHAVVLCAQTGLIHYESLSFGKRVASAVAEHPEEEADRMRRRWARICAADPYHNPNLSLQSGNEWALAFPPRVDKTTAVATGESAARQRRG